MIVLMIKTQATLLHQFGQSQHVSVCLPKC